MKQFEGYITNPLLEQIAAGTHGRAAIKSLELLCGIARAFDAPRLIPVSSVQISGVSSWNLGEEGLQYLEELAQDGAALVPATLNPAGFNPGVPPPWVGAAEASRQQRVIDAYTRMGVTPTLTCAPYLWGNLPLFGTHLAWSESSAVVFANSVLGARTNREGGPTALAAALTGHTPLYGLHRTESRAPAMHIQVDWVPSSSMEWGVLGAMAGKHTKRIPVFSFPTGTSPSVPDLQALSAAIITYGGAPMFHIEGHTPEWDRYPVPRETCQLTYTDMLTTATAISLPEPWPVPDFVFLGCPHYGPMEHQQIRGSVGGERVKVGTARTDAPAPGDWLNGGCAAVAPLPESVRIIATDSAKAAFYLKNRGLKVILAPRERCLALATGSSHAS